MQWYMAGMPWKVFNPIEKTLEDNATLLMGELLFYVCTLACFWHAFKCGRHHILVLVASVVTGTANDIFFMVMPFVDNFFHAQFTVMLTPRLPLYIPCVYICFVYTCTVTVWRLGLPPIPQCAAAGLAGALYYSVYDLFGQKFLWWTWHDTDVAIAARWLGVPFGSTMWTVVHCFVFPLVLHVFALRFKHLTTTRFFATVLASAILTTPLMMIVMGPFQLHQFRFQYNPVFEVLKQPGRPDMLSLGLALVTCLTIIVFAWPERSRTRGATPWLAVRKSSPDNVLWMAAVAHFGTFAVMMLLCDPGNIVATGVHQMYGPCHVERQDLMGHVSYANLCAEDFDEDFHFDCVKQTLPPPHPEWYTLCGNPHKQFISCIAVETFLAVLGISFYSFALRHPPSKVRKAQ